MSLSKREFDELEKLVSKSVQKSFGHDNGDLVHTAVKCLDKGYDKRKITSKLSSILDDKAAGKFADKLEILYEDYKHSRKKERRRRRSQSHEEEDEVEKKKKRFEEIKDTNGTSEPANDKPLDADKIKKMMQDAQRLIAQRKEEMNIREPSAMEVAAEKMKKAADLQARIRTQLANTGIVSANALMAQRGLPPMLDAKPTPLILDDEGRTIDAKTGDAVKLPVYTPTLKANIRAIKRERFKKELTVKSNTDDIAETPYFDYRISVKTALRQKRGFSFVTKGKYVGLANRLRTKAQMDKLSNSISQAAKKTGIASAAKLAIIQPRTTTKPDEIPDIEWWDWVIMRGAENYDRYEPVTEENVCPTLKGVGHLVEHPILVRPPTETTRPIVLPVMLTKKERKKLRRQRRQENQKEQTEKIRLGLAPAPEPKVKLANLMRVLGTEAVQDPTKVEAHVRAQMAKRLKAHQDANAERKLTKHERKIKNIAKLKEDTSMGVHVSVYRVKDLSNASHKFKVEQNAIQLFMTGIVAMHRECNVIVVEGGPKQQKKYRRLMLSRIKWTEGTRSKREDGEDPLADNTCHLVWEGTVKKRSFGDMRFKACPTETFAREQFRKVGQQQYWDLAYSGAVLETVGADT